MNNSWIERKKTKPIFVGSVGIGGDHPISIQSMTNTNTADIKATVNQIEELEAAGADIVRVSVPEQIFTLIIKLLCLLRILLIVSELIQEILVKKIKYKKLFKLRKIMIFL